MQDAKSILVQAWDSAIASIPDGRAKKSLFQICSRLKGQKVTKEHLLGLAINDVQDVEAVVHDLEEKITSKQGKVCLLLYTLCCVVDEFIVVPRAYPILPCVGSEQMLTTNFVLIADKTTDQYHRFQDTSTRYVGRFKIIPLYSVCFPRTTNIFPCSVEQSPSSST